jgi:hypothetical protein
MTTHYDPAPAPAPQQQGPQEIALSPAKVTPLERAHIRIQNEGIILLDDNDQVLELTGRLCQNIWKLPDDKVVLVHVNNDIASAIVLVELLGTTLKRRFEDTGHGFAAVISDYNLSFAGESTKIWADVVANLTPECRKKCWDSMGRVLISGYIPDEQEPDIRKTGLFDAILFKPFNAQQLKDTVLTSVASHCSGELA